MELSRDRAAEFEGILGYHFNQIKLLEEALTHPSYGIQYSEFSGVNNQRLEFLGDAVLNLILAQATFTQYPSEREGFLSRVRSALVKKGTLAHLARSLKLPEFIRMSDADLRMGNHERDAALEDTFEAIVGAIYLDSNFDTTGERVLAWYGDLGTLIRQTLEDHNPKGRLQEYLQQREGTLDIEYRIVDVRGPEHEKTFICELWITGVCRGQGQGNSKKDAEEAAAVQALSELVD